MSANRELDELQRAAEKERTHFEDAWIAITVDGDRRWVSGPYPTHDMAYDYTKNNVGIVTITPIRMQVR